MKHKVISCLLIGAVAVGLAVVTPPAQAQDPVRKLGRGFANVLFGMAELPSTVVEVSREHGGGAAITWGVLKGLGRFVGRELAGVYEVATFPIPLPRGYEPIIQPEFLISGDRELD